MESLQQQQQQQQGADTVSSSWRKGSNRIVAIHVEGEITPPHTFSLDQQTTAHDEKQGWRKFTAIVGPGFLVSMAYIDPGSMETDLQTGATHRYQLLWIITMGMVFALIIQSLAANLGVTTGKHLAEIYRAEYPKYVKYGLWLTAEVAVTCADIPEVIGSAFALNILFKIPLWIGVLLTGCSTLLLLGIQRYGVRKLEFLITGMILTMAGCFFGEMSYVKPPASDLFKGMFVPKITGTSAAGDAVSNIGSIIMPHNLFLHSALVLSRKAPASVHGINDTRRYFLIETAFALFVAFLINVSLTSVTATVCFAENLSSDNAERCNNLTLNSASFLLENVLGRFAKYVYGIALLASGQSSAITGTYAGQYIMQGFLDIKMTKWKRNLMTRSIAMTPSLLVAIIGGSSASGNLIIVTNMVIAFGSPFTIIPLLRFSYSSRKMGAHKNSIVIIVISWIVSCGIIGINLYFLSTTFIRWLIHNSLPKVANVFIGIIVFPLMAFYGLVIIYLTFRKDKAVINRMGEDQGWQTQLEMGNGGGRQVEEEYLS